MTPLEMAKVIMRATEINQKSFDHIACYQDDFVYDARLKRLEGDVQNLYRMVDYKKYTKKPVEQAIIQALKEANLDLNFFYPILYAFHWWNDLIDWSTETIRKEMWEYSFISRSKEDYKKYVAWDETQANEIGQYDTWIQAVFHINEYAKTLEVGYDESKRTRKCISCGSTGMDKREESSQLLCVGCEESFRNDLEEN